MIRAATQADRTDVIVLAKSLGFQQQQQQQLPQQQQSAA